MIINRDNKGKHWVDYQLTTKAFILNFVRLIKVKIGGCTIFLFYSNLS